MKNDCNMHLFTRKNIYTFKEKIEHIYFFTLDVRHEAATRV